MNQKFNIKRVLITLGLFFVFLVVIITGIFIFSRTLGEGVYCREVRKQENIGIDHSCSEGKPYSRDGKNYVNISVGGPRSNIIDLTIYTMNTKTLEIEHTAVAD